MRAKSWFIGKFPRIDHYDLSFTKHSNVFVVFREKISGIFNFFRKTPQLSIKIELLGEIIMKIEIFKYGEVFGNQNNFDSHLDLRLIFKNFFHRVLIFIISFKNFFSDGFRFMSNFIDM